MLLFILSFFFKIFLKNKKTSIVLNPYNLDKKTKYRQLHYEDHKNIKHNYKCIDDLYNGINIGNIRSIDNFQLHIGINYKEKKFTKTMGNLNYFK